MAISEKKNFPLRGEHRTTWTVIWNRKWVANISIAAAVDCLLGGLFQLCNWHEAEEICVEMLL